jgi:hypothetical protein
MDITKLQKIYADFDADDAALVAQQEAATNDRLRFELERMRRWRLIRLEATVTVEFARDFRNSLSGNESGKLATAERD